MSTVTVTVATRGTSNSNQRGNTEDRRRRRAFIMATYASDIRGYCRCYRCGQLLFNPDTPPVGIENGWRAAAPLTIDRIIPGCKGGSYRRNNIRPACGGCNSETGGPLAGQGKRK